MLSASRSMLALGLAALSLSSFAATTVYTSSAAFLSNVVPGSYTESFTGLSATPPSTFTSGSFSYTLSATDGLYGSGDFIGTNLPNQQLLITFSSSNITAVGGNFYATNISDAFQSTSITLTLADNTTATFTPASAAGSYRGFTSTAPITSLRMTAPGASLYAGLDNLTVGVAAVPEPASALLMALGAAGLLLARQRRA